jgi:hypothetical protein
MDGVAIPIEQRYAWGNFVPFIPEVQAQDQWFGIGNTEG